MALRPFIPRLSGASYDVCAIGNAIVDIIAECEDAFLQSHGIAKGVMTLIDEARADTLYDRIGPAVEMSGGSAANTAFGIASLGGLPAYIGKVKDDQLGKIFRHDLKTMGVHFTTPALTDGPSTARCMILVTPDAQRSMNTYLGACAELTEEDIDPDVVAGSQVTYLEGYLFDKPAAKRAFGRAARFAHDASRYLVLTLSDPFCVERHRDSFRELVRDDVDILLANEHELMSLYQISSFDEALNKAREQCSLVAATRSEKGAVIVKDGETLSILSEPVANVVDTTGAGDLFAAGFLYGLTHGHDLETSGRLGAIAAGEIISHYGPRPQRTLRDLAKAKGIRV